MIIENICPYCGTKLDIATKVNNFKIDNESMPKPGAISLCFSCGELSIFNDGLYMRKMTQKDMEDFICQDPVTFMEAMIAIKLVKKRLEKKMK